MHSGVVLVGPPNAGKTTLYNWLTGSHFSTVNYPGSTVEYAVGKTLGIYGDQLDAIDTPGIYSLFARSPEEAVTVRALFAGTPPHVVVAVVDATNLSRHLFIARQLQESGFKVIVALTMVDLLKKKGQRANVSKLSKHLGVPVFAIDGRLGGGVKELVEAVYQKASTSPSVSLKPIVEWSSEKIESVHREMSHVSSDVIESEISHRPVTSSRVDETTARMDSILLHPVLGLLGFVLIMGGLFSSIYWMAQPMMDVVDGSFSEMADQVDSWGEGTLWANFLSKGLITGVGSVLVFVPQIFILFLGMILLEDWGYLARAATIIDRPLSKLGLNGRAFVPLLSGYACAIPAMMAARTISSKRERLLTLFIIPLMSCSARLPVYALLLAFLFHDRPAWQPGLVLLALYVLSFVIGAVAATLASRVYRETEKSWFMMELPIYRRPVFSHVLKSAGRRTFSYIQKAGPAILVLSLLIWAATTFPNYGVSDENQRLATSYAATGGRLIEPLMEPMGADWRIGVSLIAAFAAREVFVSALALIFNVTDTEDDTIQESLLMSMRSATTPDGQTLFTPASVVALVLFFMIALQCLATVAVSKKESGSWKFALSQVIIFTSAAYAVAVVTYQIIKTIT